MTEAGSSLKYDLFPLQLYWESALVIIMALFKNYLSDLLILTIEVEINMNRQWLNYIGIILILLVFWVAVSGSLSWPQLVVGLATAIFVTYFNRNLLITAEERPPIRLRTIIWLFGYLFQLLWAIVIANFHVAWIVLHPKMPIEPNLVSLEVDIDRVSSRVLLANSITLTPGTLTVLADEKKFLVHALTVSSGEDLKEWSLIDRIREMEEA
ncbi:MAG: Na+/H+ antiporter subunit E [Dethiobacteria bacterium]